MSKWLDIVSNVLDQLEKQLVTQVDHVIDHYGDCADEALLRTINTGSFSWINKAPYCDMEFEFNMATFTLQQLVDMVELVSIDKLSKYDFLSELTLQVREMVQHRLDKKLPEILEEEAAA